MTRCAVNRVTAWDAYRVAQRGHRACASLSGAKCGNVLSQPATCSVRVGVRVRMKVRVMVGGGVRVRVRVKARVRGRVLS